MHRNFFVTLDIDGDAWLNRRGDVERFIDHQGRSQIINDQLGQDAIAIYLIHVRDISPFQPSDRVLALEAQGRVFVKATFRVEFLDADRDQGPRPSDG